MDVGAAFCRKRDPRCDACPLAPRCRYLAAGRPASTDARRPQPKPFPSTTRWLRGRIMDRLRDAPDAAWVEVVGPIGEHPAEVVATEVANLAREGLLEADGSRHRARLRTGP
jgi:A/G-specific adenine glycosylase